MFLFSSFDSYVSLKLFLPTSVHRGPGMWKLNTSHLKDLSFLLLVTQFWESWRNEKRSFHNLSAWWDAGKSRLKLLIRNFSRKKASAFRKRISSLERTLYFLNRRAEHGEDVAHLLTDVRSDLRMLIVNRLGAVEYVQMFNGQRRAKPLLLISLSWNSGTDNRCCFQPLGQLEVRSYRLSF